MNPPSTSGPAFAPEQLTAWALDELSGTERVAFESEMAANPDLHTAAGDTRSFCRLLEQELLLRIPDGMHINPVPAADNTPAHRGSRRRRIRRVLAACTGVAAILTVAVMVRNSMQTQTVTVGGIHDVSPQSGYGILDSEKKDFYSHAIAPVAYRFPSSGVLNGPVRFTFDSLPARYYVPPGFPPPSAESYSPTGENTFREAGREPLSTFSIDVDTASYANVRRFLMQSMSPPVEAVRLEELVNYFPYDYAGPAAGDAHPFAVHVATTACPWEPQHRLTRIAIRGRDPAPGTRPAANLVFLVDVSGSMQPDNKLPLIKQSLSLLLRRLTPEDRVAIVTYAGESGVALPSTPVSESTRIQSTIDGLTAGGSTNGAGGIEAAYSQAAAGFLLDGVNRVILCTDGDFNTGITSHTDLQSLIAEKAKSGVFLSVLGYGMGNLKDDTMELLADRGNGNYAYIDSLSEARKVLESQMNGTLTTIAKDVKIQVEFNPAAVRSYRLLGYENRMLAGQEFNDDQKDAGEIGAGHTVTALYEIVPADADTASPAAVDPLRYQQNAPPHEAILTPAARTGELMTVKLRYKDPDGAASRLIERPVTNDDTAANDRELRWAAAVAGYAMLLTDSPQKGSLTWESVRSLAASAKGDDPHGYRGEFLQLIDRAAGIFANRR